jgi:Kef-type K+ transport system membrane component KefB
MMQFHGVSTFVHGPSPGAGLSDLLSLLIVFSAAKIGEELFERLKQPSLIGQILAGFLIGPILHWVSPTPSLEFMAEIGVIFLLFQTGLETRPEEVVEHGYMSMAVAVLGVLTPLVVGWAFALLAGENQITSAFVGVLLTATSIGITAKILADFGAMDTAFGRVILGAAVIDDVLGLLALSTFSSFAARNVRIANLLLTLAFVIGFIALLLYVRQSTLPRVSPRIVQLRASSPVWSFALVVLLAFSALSAYVGLAAIIGAFLAGMFVGERPELGSSIRPQADAVSSFVVPFFLANIGLQVDPAHLVSGHALFLIASLTLIAIVTKLVACGLTALPLGKRSALLVGLGMIPRGEVGIVVAGQSLRIAAIPTYYYDIGIVIAVLTSIIGPLLLRLVMRPAREHAPELPIPAKQARHAQPG